MESLNYQSLFKGKKQTLASVATKLNELAVELLGGLKALTEIQAAKPEVKNNDTKVLEMGTIVAELLKTYNNKIVEINLTHQKKQLKHQRLTRKRRKN